MGNSEYNYIFNRKLLEKKLDHFSFEHIPELKNKMKILKNWKYSLENSNLNKTKEESVQGDFLTAFFTDILGYKKRYGNKLWNINQEQKSIVDGSKSDGALGFFSDDITDVRVVIELKDAKTHLDKKQNRELKITPVEQAFSYASKSGRKCNWVIVSNFTEIRFYHSSDQSVYETFQITELVDEQVFKRFYYLLSSKHLINRDEDSLIERLYKDNELEQEKITKDFYKDFKQTRLKLYDHLKRNNPTSDKLILFEKTQKLLDRLIFVCFCEDTELLPERIIRKVIEVATSTFDVNDMKIWTQLKGLFHSIDKGNPPHDINRFNGGLFKQDPILDSLIIKDEIFSDLVRISEYDFGSDLNVNILGHIFEQSISDIEEIKEEISGIDESEKKKKKKKGKRKQDGIYYTPEYVTRYMVGETIEKWLEDKRKELGEERLSEIPELKVNMKKTEKAARTRVITSHIEFWTAYQDAFRNIKILDPACGSGAFLNQAFDILYREGQRVNKLLGELQGGQISSLDLDKEILKNNLFGVDLNNESVEITKLALWIKTANKHDQLTSLDENILSGNSLISEGDLSDTPFQWETKYQNIMKEGGFDIIIGNPPYGAGISDEVKNYLKVRYDSFSGVFDVYTAFVQLSIELLKDNGYLAFIIPVAWQTGSDYTAMRQYLDDHTVFKQGIKLPYDIFEDAYVDTGIYMFQKNSKRKQYASDVFEFPVRFNREFSFQTQIAFEQLPSSYWKKTDDKKLVLNPSFYTLNNKVRKKSDTLGKITNSIRGILPRNEDVIETAVDDSYKTYFMGGLYRYEIQREFKYVKYGDNLKEYPRDYTYFTGERILIRRLISRQFRIMAAYADEEFVNKKDIYVFKVDEESDANIFYILGIVNSKLMSYLMTKGSTAATKDDYSQITLTELRSIPVKKVNKKKKKEVGNLANKLTNTMKEIVTRAGKDHRLLQAEYQIDKLSKKLKAFHELTPEELLKELKKVKVTLTLSQKSELLDWFAVEKVELQDLHMKLNKFQQELDQAIYEIYNLDSDEIELVESEMT